MTGLIRKDFLVMRKALKSYLLLVGFYIFLAYLDLFDYSFIITFVQVVLAVLPITAFAYDEQAKWDRYAMALPLGRRGVVRARYLFVLVLALLTMALGLAGTGLLYLVRQADPPGGVIPPLVCSSLRLGIPPLLLPPGDKKGGPPRWVCTPRLVSPLPCF